MKRWNWIILMMVATMAVPPLTAFSVPPAIPSTPAAVEELVYARPFTLQEGYTSDWSRERPIVTSGVLLVLKVNPDLVYPRQVAEPVLYVGDRTAERMNVGFRSGYVIAIVPGHVDLTEAPIWFGTPELPERVDAERIRSERALADSARIKPFGPGKIHGALARGGNRLEVGDRTGLLRQVVPLIVKYSPAEKSLAESLAPAVE